MRTVLLIVASLLVACAKEPHWSCADAGTTFCVDGLPVMMDPEVAASFGSSAVESRIARQLQMAFEYWGTPRDLANGWRIRYQDKELVECNGVALFAGCFAPHDKTITLGYYHWSDCIEASPLPHEIGHFFEAPGHTDPRWCDFGVFYDELKTVPECANMVAPMWEAITCPREGW